MQESEKLAIDGGEPAVTLDKDELLRWPRLDREEEEAVVGLIRKSEISTSSEPDEFAREFQEFLGGEPEYYLPCYSGTSALYSAFFCAGVGPGTEVIGPAYTYWASTTPAAALGGRVVFAEVDEKSLCLDPEDFKEKITPKTKAVVPVHVWGWPAEIDDIVEIAHDHGIAVVEDAAHAHGAEYKGKKVGTIGDIGCFSFQASKLLPAGEGGMFVTANKEFYEKATALGHYERVGNLSADYSKYAKTGFGFKHRMSPLHAAIARVQLRKYPEVNEWVTKHSKKFREFLSKFPGFRVHEPPDYIKRVYYENVVQFWPDDEGCPFEDDKELVWLLQSEGVWVNDSRYSLLNTQPFYLERGHSPDELPRTNEIREHLIRFPNFHVPDEEYVEQYCHAIEKVYELYPGA
ncbi:MAG: DegT/DnrJ/EryC1/StrS aminotransferase family protein [Promethearchaeota archaeon]